MKGMRMFHFLKKKTTTINLRPWEPRDVPYIHAMECQYEEGEPPPVDCETLHRWISNECMCGIVVTENTVPRGYAAIFTPKTPLIIIQTLRVDREHRRHGHGTLMLNHIFSMLIPWNKVHVKIDISERNEKARQFLMRPDNARFVITALSEYTDNDGSYTQAFYEMQYPAPLSFKPKDIKIFLNGKEKK
jgi:GNAT superfamily N-acetyltransferase